MVSEARLIVGAVYRLTAGEHRGEEVRIRKLTPLCVVYSVERTRRGRRDKRNGWRVKRWIRDFAAKGPMLVRG